MLIKMIQCIMGGLLIAYCWIYNRVLSQRIFQSVSCTMLKSHVHNTSLACHELDFSTKPLHAEYYMHPCLVMHGALFIF
mgnify:CR=1 FL=1